MSNSEIKYTSDFSWVRLSQHGDHQCGITDLGQQALGSIIYIELPAVGDSVIQGEPCAILESRKSIVDIVAPLTGKIVQVNRQLLINPELVNSSPYIEGWLFYIRSDETHQSQWLQLLTHEPGCKNQ